MKVSVDLNLCQAHGECAYVAPEIFELGDDEVLRWDERPAEALRDKVEQSVRVCPVQAISLHA